MRKVAFDITGAQLKWLLEYQQRTQERTMGNALRRLINARIKEEQR